MKLKSIILFAFVVFVFQLTGCASTPKVATPTTDDQIIIEAGRQRAKELGLNPLPTIGDAKKGRVTIVGPTKATYNRQGKWIITERDLVINACKGPITLEGISINRGEYARRLNQKFSVIE